MAHKCLPKGKTPEALADIIKKNAAEEPIAHEEQIPLTKERVQELEHKSSVASRAIDSLKKVKELFDKFLKEGTPVNLDTKEGSPEHLPQSVTIPPTKGLKLLQENREWADALLLQGYEIIRTPLYLMPWPEEEKMVAVDIEGTEFPGYTRDMSDFEKERYGELFKTKKG